MARPKGIPCSEEEKLKLSLLHKGKPKSEETRKKMSEAAKKKKLYCFSTYF